MIISDFHQFGGTHTETGALRRVLEYLGATAPHGGRTYSEQLLFGIGGGLGFGYFLFERSGTHVIHLETRIHTRETEQPEFLSRICSRICAPLRLVNSSSQTAAVANLKRLLGQNRPPIVSVDPFHLPYLGLTTPLHTYYCVIPYGFDESADRVFISDRSREPLTLTRAEFLRARESSWSPKFRVLVVSKPEEEPDLPGAVLNGIQDCCRQMNEGLGITNFGLNGFDKWATVLTSPKEKKSWPKIFPPGPNLFESLYSIFVQISGRSGTGNGQRAFYAEFLEEAADVLSKPDLRSAAEQYRLADRVWAEVADAHLPDSIAGISEAKELIRRRVCLFETKGADGVEEIRSIHHRLAEIEKQASENFSLSAEDVRSLLNDLKVRIGHLREVEAEALHALESAVGMRA